MEEVEAQEETPNQTVEEEEVDQDMMKDLTDMKVISVMKEKTTQVEEEKELEESIAMAEIAMTGTVIPEEMAEMREVKDKIEEMEEKIIIEIITEMTEGMTGMEDMAVGTAGQEMVPEDTVRRLEAMESLL